MKKSSQSFCSLEMFFNSAYHCIRPCLVSTRSHLVPRKKIFGFVLTLKRRKETFSFSFFVFFQSISFAKLFWMMLTQSEIRYHNFNQNQIILQQSFENCDFCETRINKLGNQIYKVKRTIYFCTIKLQFCQ